MALPSSPPLLPEPDLPSSPIQLPLPSYLSVDRPNRKRYHSEYSNLSSDPLFSEDGSEVGSQHGRRKRMVRGPWFELAQKRLGDGSKDHVRNLDSGIFMGSDLSEDSLDGISTTRSVDWNMDRKDWPYRASNRPVTSQAPPAAERKVQECIETGKESVDLSDLGLKNLTSNILLPLKQLIRQSHNDLMQPPSEDEFSALTPSIKLFLARNRISSLPPELFQLDNITVLSLRSNSLTELPPSIARLGKLEELNISGNHIRYLPWELLSFLKCSGKHRRITVRPNPLIEPTSIDGPDPLSKLPLDALNKLLDMGWTGEGDEGYDEVRQHIEQYDHLGDHAELELRLNYGRIRSAQHRQYARQAGAKLSVCREELLHLGSSAVQYFDVDGVPCQRAESDENLWAFTTSKLRALPPSFASRSAPSLFELSLRTVQSHFELDDIPCNLPPRVKTALQKAQHGVSFGNQKCSTCGVPFVLPRAEWMEYWFNGLRTQAELTSETILPFLRKACNWACARPSEIGESRR